MKRTFVDLRTTLVFVLSQSLSAEGSPAMELTFSAIVLWTALLFVVGASHGYPRTRVYCAVGSQSMKIQVT